MSDVNSKTRMFDLHERVLVYFERELDEEEVNLKTVEAAMRFLEKNNVRVDLNGDRADRKAKLAVIPRLSDEELKLG